MKIVTTITLSSTFGSNTINVENILPESDTLDHSDVSSWKLDSVTGPAFSLDLITLINSATSSEIKNIHVQCRTIKASATDVETPVEFDVMLGALDLGALTQLTLGGLNGFTQSGLTISNVAVPTGKTAVLVATFSVDKA